MDNFSSLDRILKNYSGTHQIVHVCAFPISDSQSFHGGSKRSKQLAREISANHTFSLAVGRQISPMAIFHLLTISPSAPYFRGNIKAWLQSAFIKANFRRFLRSNAIERNSIFFVEIGPEASFSVAKYLIGKGCVVYLLPHNVEFLVPGQTFTGLTKSQTFAYEFELYRSCSAVLCISEFDAYVLKCLGVERIGLSEFKLLREDFNRATVIRQLRQTRQNYQGILYIGSVTNAPTRRGLKMLLDEYSLQTGNLPLLRVIGKGTEQFRNLYTSPNIEIEGTVSDDRKNELLATCEAVVLKQSPTSGFLTRIAELDACGLKVLINHEYLQLRLSKYNSVFFYKDVGDILEILKST